MTKTRKVQVTFDEDAFHRLAERARREGKKLAAIVREAAEEYAIGPESERSKRKALEELLSLEPAPSPPDYREWKREYGERKSKAQRNEF